MDENICSEKCYTIVFVYTGNQILHQLTSSKAYNLRIDLEEFNGTRWFAVYANASIGNEAAGYVLTLGDYRGDAGRYTTYYNNSCFGDSKYFSIHCHWLVFYKYATKLGYA